MLAPAGSNSLHDFPRIMHWHCWNYRVSSGFWETSRSDLRCWKGTPGMCVILHTPESHCREACVVFWAPWETLWKGHKWKEWSENHSPQPSSASEGTGALSLFLPFTLPARASGAGCCRLREKCWVARMLCLCYLVSTAKTDLHTETLMKTLVSPKAKVFVFVSVLEIMPRCLLSPAVTH